MSKVWMKRTIPVIYTLIVYKHLITIHHSAKLGGWLVKIPVLLFSVPAQRLTFLEGGKKNGNYFSNHSTYIYYQASCWVPSIQE